MKNRIRELREARKMSQVRLSVELEVSQETISAYESGRHFPSFVKLVQLSDLFGVTIDYLMGRTDEMCCSISNLTPKEQDLLGNYRKMDEIQQAKAEAYLQGLLD